MKRILAPSSAGILHIGCSDRLAATSTSKAECNFFLVTNKFCRKIPKSLYFKSS